MKKKYEIDSEDVSFGLQIVNLILSILLLISTINEIKNK